MLNEALLFLLQVLLQPFAAILLLRFLMQWLRVPFRNPVGEMVLALTDFIVLPVRRKMPAMGRADSATLLLALLLETLYLGMLLWLQDIHPTGYLVAGLLLWAAVKLLKIGVYLLMAAVFIQAILSWINPYSPVAPLLAGFTLPFLHPLRRYIPLAGRIDFTPMVLLILCQLVIIVPLGWLERIALGLL